MPYFEELNILFIHIPKTGGSSVEKYFEKKINKKLSKNFLYSKTEKFNEMHSYQHMTFNEILKNKELLKININDETFIFTIVRNPYERIISELFFRKMINKSSSPEYVEKKIINYLKSKETYDNHKIPQYSFIIFENSMINNNIKIIKTENLNNDMKYLGFNDFENIEELKTHRNNLDYYSYLNNNSIKNINEYYVLDFIIFDYKQINTIESFENNNINNYNKNNNKIIFVIFFIMLYILSLILLYIFL